MGVTVCLENISPGGILDIVHELEDRFGIMRNVDFSWEFHRRITNENPPYNIIQERYTAFTFQDAVVATWFRLQYG